MAEDGGQRPGGSGYREVTFWAIAFALIIGVVMNAAITYSGLKIGFTIGGSAIAAVVGFGILRGLGRLFSPSMGSILEANIAQTAASAINTSNSGIIFTVPVLLLLGIPLAIDGADFWLITLAGMAGAILGAAFIIPLRKQMIDIDRLRFPTGTGVAVILKSPGAGPMKALVLVVGILVSMLIFLPSGLDQLGLRGYEDAGRWLSKEVPLLDGVLNGDKLDVGGFVRNVTGGFPGEQFELVFAIAPFALGAGFITGRPGLLVLAGGILAYFVLTPVAFAMGWMPQSIEAGQAPDFGFLSFNRPLGIGLLLGGAMMGVVASLPAISQAIRSVAAASRAGAGGADELGLKPLIAAAVGAVLLLFAAANFIGNEPVNDRCPVTATALTEDLVAADAARPFVDAGAGEEAIKEARQNARASFESPDGPTREARGYTLRFATDEAAATWDGWTAEQRETRLDEIGARAGWLAGLPSIARSLIIAIVGALWIWLAGIIIAQCTGMTDWSPISGMALLTVVLVMLLAGSKAVLGAVLIGAALCVAITLAADMMSDLRTGHLVGAKPRRQQLVELSVVALGPAIAMTTILVLAAGGGADGGPAFGPGTDIPAPQADALRAVINGVQGEQMPYALYGAGALLGAVLGLGAFSGLGVLVGLSMYLPFFYISTYGVGCIVQMALVKVKGRAWCEDWGVPFAAGMIVGESLLGVVISIIRIAQG